MGRKPWAGVLGVVVLAGLSASCGGSNSAPPAEPNQQIACDVLLTDPGQPSDNSVFPMIPQQEPLACVPPNSSAAAIDAKCTSKCMSQLSTYAAFINANDNPPTAVIVGTGGIVDLTCTVEPVTLPSSPMGCPNTDPPGQPEPLFSGGPAQYVADLSGDLSLSVATGTIAGTVGFGPFAMSGEIAYAIAPIDRNCPPAGCQLLITSLNLQAPAFTASKSITIPSPTFPIPPTITITLFSDTVSNLTIQNVGWIAGTWQPNGKFQIPANTARAVLNFVNNGSAVSFDQFNTNALTGTIDPIAGTVSFDSFPQTLNDTTVTINPLSGSNVSVPPIAVITLPTTVQCNETNAAAVTLDASASSAPGDSLHFITWQVNGGLPIAGNVPTSAALNLGTNNVLLNVFNSGLAVGIADETVTVVDTLPPTFAPLPATITQTLCNPATQLTVVPIPTATDICSPTVTVTGAVVSSNGSALTTPIPIVNGSVSLPPGVNVIQWTAADQSGNVATTEQTLTVRPGIEANGTISIDNDAIVRLPNGTPSVVANTGTGQVSIGVTATTGNVLTEGSVFLASRANVQGSIQAAGTLNEQPPVTVTGTITTGAHVPLPAGPTLAGIIFPSPLGAPIDLEPGAVRSLAPGTYTSIAVKSRAVLTLSTGVYFVGSLDLEPQAFLDLNQAAGPVQLYVQSSIIDRGQIQSISGTAGGFVLGYAGKSTFFVQSPFLAGTLIAPNADVVISSLGSNAFTGELFAQSYEVQPDATVTCDTTGSAQPGASSPLSVAGFQPEVFGASGAPTALREGSPGAGAGCSLAIASSKGGWPGTAAGSVGIGAALTLLRRRRPRARSPRNVSRLHEKRPGT